MAVVRPAFQFDPSNKIPERCRKIPCHMIFDVKPDLTRKARFVTGGHMTDPPAESVTLALCPATAFASDSCTLL
jgi:hypothetical protein